MPGVRCRCLLVVGARSGTISMMPCACRISPCAAVVARVHPLPSSPGCNRPFCSTLFPSEVLHRHNVLYEIGITLFRKKLKTLSCEETEKILKTHVYKSACDISYFDCSCYRVRIRGYLVGGVRWTPKYQTFEKNTNPAAISEYLRLHKSNKSDCYEYEYSHQRRRST